VLIVLAVVVVLGGGAGAYFLFVKSGPGPAGRYVAQPACTKLSAAPYKFVGSPAAMEDGALKENCTANLGNEPTDGSAIVEVDIYPGQGGVGNAQRNTVGDSQTVPGTGFENPLNATYQAATVAGNYCAFDYYRSNEYVQIGFNYVAGVRGRDDCVSVTLPYVKQLYSQIG